MARPRLQNLHQLKEEICDIGRRIYLKGFAAGNDGNISYRIGENEVLCTPTMVSKGFLKPADLCTVDLEGNQLSGQRKRTSEILLHLAIMRARPEVKSVVHCHPPHATAFAVAREPIPQCVLPEVEVFLGDVPITQYETPGGQAFADTVLPFVHKSNVIILANHGTVSFGETVERAYWWTEILDAYCRILMLAKDLGRVTYFSEDKERELLALKTKWGYRDARLAPGMENCDICANDVFRSSWAQTGVERKAFESPPPMPGPAAPAPAADQEVLIRTITDRVLAALAAR
jgi:L-fuculose-phosphate aldolase